MEQNLTSDPFCLIDAIDASNARETLQALNGTHLMTKAIVRVYAIAKVERNRPLFDLALDGMVELAAKTGNKFDREAFANQW